MRLDMVVGIWNFRIWEVEIGLFKISLGFIVNFIFIWIVY